MVRDGKEKATIRIWMDRDWWRIRRTTTTTIDIRMDRKGRAMEKATIEIGMDRDWWRRRRTTTTSIEIRMVSEDWTREGDD
ncbi:hypothetical protein GCK72_017049 [Caenorhabditis remanei]|uniref:Uncharacterized protein n=1 Tax=Caenorhabditis remanei TaxID=31234 RepID=A0A6A5G7N6_CAERE|nr:hypothetical protein GCK72_017049 [Caenorhabditis remanei]KAF1750499.1 hypothetical protein GCK72_017049 [Caenorhabditis remanei]